MTEDRAGREPGTPPEPKRSEEALRESEQSYRLLAEAVRDDVIYRFRFAPRLGFEFVSNSVLAMTGYTPQEFYDNDPSCAWLIHPDDMPKLLDLTLRLNDPEPIDGAFEIRWMCKDGRVIWTDQRAVPIMEDGAVVAVQAIARDVTDRFRVSAALRASEERYARAMSAVNDALWESNLLTGEVYYSTQWAAMLGLSPDDLSNDILVWSSRIHPDDTERCATTLQGYLAGGDSRFELEHRLRHADGTYRWVLSRGNLVRDAEGMPVLMSGSNTDITERRTAEEAKRRSDAQFRSLIEASLDSISVLRGERIIYCNAATLRMLGLTDSSEIVGVSSWTDWIHPDDHARIREAIENQRSRDQVATQELRFVRQDASVGTVESYALPIEFEQAPALLVVSRDVTERKQLDARLLQADRMLAMGTLAAGVAHEINNPLSYMLTNVEHVAARLPELVTRLRATPVDGSKVEHAARMLEEMASVLQEAHQGGERVRSIVRDLQTLSRGDDDTRVPIDVCDALEAAIQMSGNEIRHRARLVRRFSRVARVMANEQRLVRAFLNLLVNAAHAIPDGAADENQITVTVSTRLDGMVLVEVSDTGCGISPEVLRRVFDPFFTTKPVGVGTGLGLSLCHGIVTSIGGELTAESEVGRGSTFRVTLQPTNQARPEKTPAERRWPDGAQRMRVLVVDDDALVARALVRLLGTAGARAEIASGRDAHDRLVTQTSYDAIFCDLMMPEMSGMELYERVTAVRPELADRFVFMTGGAFTARSREFLSRHRARRCLEKPFRAVELKEALREISTLNRPRE